jgi:hypothetical protein
VYDRCPEQVATLHDLVREHLDRGPHGTFPDGYGHVADHIREIFPALMNDSRSEPLRAPLVDEYSRLPATPETRLRNSYGENSLPVYVVPAGVFLLAVVAVTVAYCLSGDDPAPGESAPAHC